MPCIYDSLSLSTVVVNLIVSLGKRQSQILIITFHPLQSLKLVLSFFAVIIDFQDYPNSFNYLRLGYSIVVECCSKSGVTHNGISYWIYWNDVLVVLTRRVFCLVMVELFGKVLNVPKSVIRINVEGENFVRLFSVSGCEISSWPLKCLGINLGFCVVWICRNHQWNFQVV